MRLTTAEPVAVRLYGGTRAHLLDLDLELVVETNAGGLAAGDVTGTRRTACGIYLGYEATVTTYAELRPGHPHPPCNSCLTVLDARRHRTDTLLGLL